MNLFGVGTGELILIMAIALLVLGPERLPEAVREGAKMIRKLRSISDEIMGELNRELNLKEMLDPTAPLPPKPKKKAPAAKKADDESPRIAPPNISQQAEVEGSNAAENQQAPAAPAASSTETAPAVSDSASPVEEADHES